MKSKLFTGTANKALALQIANRLNLPLERTEVGTFSDGETHVELKDNVRGCKAFIIQPTCAPVNDTLMELILLADALHRSSAEKIIAIVPYYGYARQDRRPGYARTPISARVVANMIETANINHIVTLDLHSTQTQGFFETPVDNLSAGRLFVRDIQEKYALQAPIVVAADAGGVQRARAISQSINSDLAIIDKRRQKANVSEVMNLIGDVRDRTCIICDDMVDTAGTLCKAADALMEKGAKEVIAYCTHPILSGSANDTIDASSIKELIVTDTIPLKDNASKKIRQITTADILAETIRRLDNGSSISELSN